MKRTEILADLRQILDDLKEPYAWDDSRLMRLLALGQDQFCRDTGFFRDASSYTITTEEGVELYPLPDRIIEVQEVRLDGSRLRKFRQGQRPSYVVTNGKPIAWQTDRETGKIGFFPPPDGVYTINLAQVHRKSLIPFNRRTATGAYDAEMEIPEEFRLAPAEWAAWQAFNDHDRELQDPVKAADHKANYDHYVRDGRTAFHALHSDLPTFAPNPAYVV